MLSRDYDITLGSSLIEHTCEPSGFKCNSTGMGVSKKQSRHGVRNSVFLSEVMYFQEANDHNTVLLSYTDLKLLFTILVGVVSMLARSSAIVIGILLAAVVDGAF